MEKSGSYEYKREMKKEQQDCKRRIIKNAISIGIGIALVFGAKQLKSEEIITSTPTEAVIVSTIPPQTVSTNTLTDISSSTIPANQPIVKKQNQPEMVNVSSSSTKQIILSTEPVPSTPNIQEKLIQNQIVSSKVCKYSGKDFEDKILNGKKLYSCLFDSDNEKVESALSVIFEGRYKSNPILEKNISSRIIEIIENRDKNEQIFSSALRLAEKRDLFSVIPILTNSFDSYDFWLRDEAIKTFNYFAIRGDVNSINMLLSLINYKYENIKVQAIAGLMFVNKKMDKQISKNVFHEISAKFRSENNETKCDIFMNMTFIYMENEKYLSFEDKEILLERIEKLKQKEKNEDVLHYMNRFNRDWILFKI